MRRRNKLRTCLHFVWATKDRLPLISEEIETSVYNCIKAICRNNRCAVQAVGGMPDHVHLLIILPTTISLGQLMQQVKGGTSRFISTQLRPGEWFAWQPNYAVFAVSPSHKERVIRYIQNQKQRHAEGTLWPEAEETDEEDTSEKETE